jgi:hypothetical protein
VDLPASAPFADLRIKSRWAARPLSIYDGEIHPSGCHRSRSSTAT